MSLPENMEAQSPIYRKFRNFFLWALVFFCLYLARIHGYLLFHGVAEVFSIVVACTIFLVTWNARRSHRNGYFLFVGTAYLFAGALDLLHMFAYKGMGVFPGHGTNLPTQLWIAARYLQAVSLLLAPRFADRPLNAWSTFGGFAAAASLLLASIFTGTFPDCFIEGRGLTPFKIYSEYAISAILFSSILLLHAKREQFERDVIRPMILSIAVAICSELMFTLYKDVYGLFNLAGHYLKIVSFYFAYRAVIVVDLARRFELNRLLQKELEERVQVQAELRAAKEGLETRVAERTSELSTLAERLKAELANRLRAEEALRESESRFRSLVEHSPVGVCLVRQGRIMFMNPEQDRLFGSIPDEFDLRDFRDVHPEDAEKFAKLAEAVSGKGSCILETDLRFFPYGKSAEGTGMKWVHVRAIPMEYRGEDCVLISMVDITGRKEMEHQLAAHEKMASLGQVAAGIAHEIRNPLSGINIYLSALEKVQDDAEVPGEERKEATHGIIKQLKSASSRIEAVIKKVMSFTRPRAPRMEFIDIDHAIEEAIDLTSTHLRKAGVILDRSMLEDLPKCRADRQLIAQVLINLILNASQAMEGQESEKRIGISARSENGRLLLIVSDSGPGVPAALRNRVFDPFVTTRRDGFGIGLSLCRRIITDHGGTIRLGTSRWGGAEFRMEIPLEQVEVRA